MKDNAFVRTVKIINAVLVLILLLGAVAFLAFLAWEGARPSVDRGVQLAGGPENESNEWKLGYIQEVHGHDVRFIELNSEQDSGFSSGYTVDTRNVLFLAGEAFDAHWLYEKHSNLILVVAQLAKSREQSDAKTEGVTKALYYEVIASDSNGDGKLSADDDSLIALSAPDGTRYTEIERGLGRVLEFKVSDREESLLVLAQMGKNIVLKKYSLESFEKLSEKVLTDLNKGL